MNDPDGSHWFWYKLTILVIALPTLIALIGFASRCLFGWVGVMAG